MISGIVTGLLMAAFFAIAYWAYSRRNRAVWEQIAQLPLQDDTSPACCCAPQKPAASGAPKP